ncbi:hypothetical protein [Scytonema sp. NUACC26]|uniref:hypothetical protein n=1 Tax=Scytonema sp. NUACC26 TaxID=3140176 RepID=UPI0038B407AC
MEIKSSGGASILSAFDKGQAGSPSHILVIVYFLLPSEWNSGAIQTKPAYAGYSLSAVSYDSDRIAEFFFATSR